MANAQKSLTIRAIDLIFSCTICQETISSIYSSAEGDGDRGLHHSSDPQSGRVTKLWLTECAHLTCAKHLQGGGAPFHANGQVPHAPCPLCLSEKNDSTEKALFFINGTSKGEYDSNIPDAYFQTPPVNFVSGDTGFEALRFQYLALIRHALKLHETALRSAEALKHWEDRKAEIVGSLSTVAPLRDELLHAGKTLMSLDQDVSSIEAVLNRVGLSLLEPSDLQSSQGRRQRSGIAATPNRLQGSVDLGSRLAHGSAADMDVLSRDYRQSRDPPHGTTQDCMKQNGSSAKRKRASSPSDHEQPLQQVHCVLSKQKPHSRDLMPPPPVPQQRPSVHTARARDPDLDEILDQTRRTAASELSSPHSLYRGSDPRSNLTRQFDDAAVADHPRVVSAQLNANEYHVPVSQSPQSLRDTGPPRQPGSPLYFAQRYDRGSRDPLNSHQTATTPRRPDQPHSQGLNQNNWQNPGDLFVEDRPRLSNARRFGTTGGLGLSSNARSSSSSNTRQPSQSPATASAHRQRLGEAPSASPHFPPRALPSSISRSPFGSRISNDLRRIDLNTTSDNFLPPTGPNIYNHTHSEIQAPHFPSTREIIQQPSFTRGTAHLHSPAGPRGLYPNGNASVVQHNDNRPRRSTADAAGLQPLVIRQPDRLRGRMTTAADPQPSTLRRRANR